MEVEILGINKYKIKADSGIVEVYVHLETIHGSETAKAQKVIWVDRIVIHGSIALYALKGILNDIQRYFREKLEKDYVLVF